MIKTFLLILMLVTSNSLLGQKCVHSDLSMKFDFTTVVKRTKSTDEYNDSCIVTVIVKNRSTQQVVQKMEVVSLDLFGGAYTNCNAVRSFTTGKNIDSIASDNDYGDFVVADFNFDLREDIAFKNDSGGNGGPFYSYYIQNKDGFFVPEKYLTETMAYFPWKLNAKNKTLKTLVHANAREMCETTYKLNTSTNKWSKIKRKFVPYPEE